MKSSTILQAIAAMRDACGLSYDSEPAKFGWTLSNLATARMELEAELAAEHPTVEVET